MFSQDTLRGPYAYLPIVLVSFEAFASKDTWSCGSGGRRGSGDGGRGSGSGNDDTVVVVVFWTLESFEKKYDSTDLETTTIAPI